MRQKPGPLAYLKSLLLILVFTISSNAAISGQVFRDFDLDGTRSIHEPGVAGVTVVAYDDSNQIVASATTDASGNYTLSTSAGTYRIEFQNIPSYLHPGTAISGSTGPLVNNVADGSTYSVGLINTGEYCQANPDIVLTRFTKGDRNGANANVGALLKFNYTANTNDPVTTLLQYNQIGSVYGVAHARQNNITYLGTYLKRHADIGPGGIGAIYKYDHASGTVSVLVTLPGTDPRNAGAGYDWNHDTAAYVNVGKRGIGDIELSDDESTLYAVNLEDRKLYEIALNSSGDADSVNSYAIPNPCGNSIDFRPMGLGFKDGKLYVGITCTAESTVDPNNPDDSSFGPRRGDRNKLSAHVYRFVPNVHSF